MVPLLGIGREAREWTGDVQVRGMRIVPASRLPASRPLRIAIFALGVAVILWLSLAPTKEIPAANLIWDKAAHAICYSILILMGLVLSTHRRWKVVLAVLALGVAIEFAQATMEFGRQGDWRDVVANSLGVAVGWAVWMLGRRLWRLQ
jgi:VanZ family protein